MAVRGRVFLTQKSATEKWPQLEQVKIISAYQLTKHIGSFAAARHSDASKCITGHPTEDGVLFLVVEKIEIRIRIAAAKMSVAGKELDHLIGMSDWKRAQQKGINDSEDGSVHSDTEGDGNKSHCKETRSPDQCSGGITKVAPDHQITSAM